MWLLLYGLLTLTVELNKLENRWKSIMCRIHLIFHLKPSASIQVKGVLPSFVSHPRPLCLGCCFWHGCARASTGHVPLGQSPEHQEGASRSQLEFNLIFWVWEGHVPGAVWFWEQGLERFNSGLIAVLSPVLVLCPVSCGAVGRAELTSHLMDFCVSCSGDVMGKGTLLTGVQLLL